MCACKTDKQEGKWFDTDFLCPFFYIVLNFAQIVQSVYYSRWWAFFVYQVCEHHAVCKNDRQAGWKIFMFKSSTAGMKINFDDVYPY